MPPSIRPVLRESSRSITKVGKRWLSDTTEAPPKVRIPSSQPTTKNYAATSLLQALRSATHQRLSQPNTRNVDLSTDKIVNQAHKEGRLRASPGLGDSTALLGVSEAYRETSRRGRTDSTIRETELKQRLGRVWKEGDIYAPRDLGPIEQRKWLQKQVKKPADPFDLMDRNPLEFYKNFTVLNEYMSQTGRIKPRNLTGLSPKNQKRMAKAVRRAIGIGLIPSTHAHPQLIATKVGINRHIDYSTR